MRALSACARVLLCASALLLVACYHPAPPGGSYLCGEGDACPSGLSCTCGLCVHEPDEAACGFSIVAPTAELRGKTQRSPGVLSLNVAEHEKFMIRIDALTADGTTRSKFAGRARLSSTWGDVCVGESGCTTLPDQIQFVDGLAHSLIQLNRETPSPQSAILSAEFAGHVGTSGQLRLNVHAESFAREAAPVIAPRGVEMPTPQPPPDPDKPVFKLSAGYAQGAIGAPYVVKSPDGWRMYYLTAYGEGLTFGLSIGSASAAANKAFTPRPAPLISGPLVAPIDQIIGAPTALVTDGNVRLFYGRERTLASGVSGGFVGYQTIVTRSSTGFDGPFVPDAADAVLTLGNLGGVPTDCDFCSAFDQPEVLHDPSPELSGGDANALLMFFSAPPNDADKIAVVRASSPNGADFAVDPSAVLKADGVETVIYSPRVLLDGTVYKMWYSVSDARRVGTGTSPTEPCSQRYSVGYATSTDGHYWVRSDTNLVDKKQPFAPGEPPTWDAHSILVGSVVAKDGVDPSNGVDLYYSPFVLVSALTVQRCLPNGVGRATRR